MHLKKIKEYLNSKINTNFIKIYDDSKLHNYSYKKNTITHIRIIIISDDFFNISLINRHRIIFQLLKEIKGESIYSITLYTYTLDEWKDKKKDSSSNKCLKKKI